MRVLLGCALLAGCVPTSTETEYVLHRADEVALESSGDVVVPAGEGGQEVLASAGRMVTSDTTATEYAIYARRDEDGRPMLRWDTKLPLRNGELQQLMPDPHVITRPGEAVTGDALRLPGCASLYASSGSHGAFLGYSASSSSTTECYGPNHFNYALVTPWSNVASITQTTTPTHKWTAIVFLPTALGAIAGGLALAAPKHASVERRVAGSAVIGLGLAMQIPFLPSLFARTHTKKVRVPGT